MMHGVSRCLSKGSKSHSICTKANRLAPKLNSVHNIRSISHIQSIRHSSNVSRQGKTQAGKAGEETDGKRKDRKAEPMKMIYTMNGIEVVAMHGVNKVVLVISAVAGVNKNKTNNTPTLLGKAIKSSREVEVAEKNLQTISGNKMNGGEGDRVGMGGIKEMLVGVNPTTAGLRGEVTDNKLMAKGAGKPKVKDVDKAGAKVVVKFNLKMGGVNRKTMGGVNMNQRGIKLMVMVGGKRAMVVGGKRAMLAGDKGTANGKPVDVHRQLSGPLRSKNRQLTVLPILP